MIAGNKSDMPGRAVEEDADAYAKSICGEHILTSAKTGHNVKEVFERLARSKFYEVSNPVYRNTREGEADGRWPGEETG